MKPSVEQSLKWLQQHAEVLTARFYPDAHLLCCVLSVRYQGQVYQQSALGHNNGQAAQRAAIKLYRKINRAKAQEKNNGRA